MDRPKVLIVDDDDNSRGVLGDALDGEPYKLLEAVDGQQALDIADEEQPNLILLERFDARLGRHRHVAETEGL